jgi:hypothetical protein
MMNLQEQIDHTNLLLNKLKEMQAKELAKPKSKRIVIESVGCCFLSSDGSAFSSQDFTGLAENDNAFIDKESAQLQAQRNTLVYRMRVAALECPVDWSEGKENKNYVRWSFDKNNFYLNSCTLSRFSQLPHFACRTKLEIFMSSLSADEQKLLICGVE